MAKKDGSIDGETGNDLFPYMNRLYYKIAMPLFMAVSVAVLILVDRLLGFGWALLALLVCLAAGGVTVHRIGMKLVERNREKGV